MVMGIAVIWGDQNKSRLCFISDSPWNQAELKAAVVQALQLLNTITVPVNVVLDFQAAPINASEFIVNAQYLKPVSQHPNTRHILVLGASTETETMCKSYPAYRHFHFAHNFEAGQMLLSQLDYLASLGGLQFTVS